ncbi:thiamine pyrophosphate-dependent enzyme [Desulfomonile tiedjei]|uniref:2-oxoacid:ferredoxin oxidoreductase, beta subunit n=1 Tax=Desulfomonile tiedjei (strain ATCC 49306 / DSM 6799 / DCB-1) TaxID=706587 RepID=I4BZM3_DESTA|nr:thiamine pyrophosphate-dependent enzyme [Desulfomonile tiedjei]AFM22764.1 2-oxoacid:ferredoxin oxidoreductase, beta subunit [Desulfomonile tiedjei DSM 6799]
MKVKLRETVPFNKEAADLLIQKDHGLHPDDKYLKPGRIPHIWCPGCGLGVVLTSFIEAMRRKGLTVDQSAVVSGIGCTGRVAGYLDMDTYHTTHGRAIPFATGLALAKPDLHVTVFSGDGDLFAIGGNHLIHAARRNVNLKVLCVNNFNFGMTGGQVAPTTPLEARTSTTPTGNAEPGFNLPYLAHAAGAVYVARWTTFHPRQLVHSISQTFDKKGFTFIEAITPCPTGYGRPNKLGSGLEEMRYYREMSEIRNGADLRETGIRLREKIIVGTFVNTQRADFMENYRGKVVARAAAKGKGKEKGKAA